MKKKEPQKPAKINLELSRALGEAMSDQTARQKEQRRAEIRRMGNKRDE